VCCSVVQRVAACCSVLQCVAVCCSVVQCGAVCCSVLQCGAVCCSVLQCGAVSVTCCSTIQRVVVCCVKNECQQNMLQRVAACCSVLQHVAACCSEDAFLYCHPGRRQVYQLYLLIWKRLSFGCLFALFLFNWCLYCSFGSFILLSTLLSLLKKRPSKEGGIPLGSPSVTLCIHLGWDACNPRDCRGNIGFGSTVRSECCLYSLLPLASEATASTVRSECCLLALWKKKSSREDGVGWLQSVAWIK